MIVILRDIVMIDLKKLSEYELITSRVVTAPMLFNSARRLPETINRAPKYKQVMNHPVAGSLIIAEPANALIKKPEDSQIISRTGTCFI